MESLIQCDQCQLEFNRGAQTPKILPKCGHTLCLRCVKQLQLKSGNSRELTCSQCGTRQPLETGQPELLLTNDKVLKILDGVSSMAQQEGARPFY